jgi:CDGSH-type Zn-finger protein
MLEPEIPAAGPQALELPAGRHQLCSCGRSRHGWFCDGAHLGSGHLSHDVLLEKACTLLMCGCGRSRRYPLCDGSHGHQATKPWWRRWR